MMEGNDQQWQQALGILGSLSRDRIMGNPCSSSLFMDGVADMLCRAQRNAGGMSVLCKVCYTNAVLFQMLKEHYGEANKPFSRVACKVFFLPIYFYNLNDRYCYSTLQ